MKTQLACVAACAILMACDAADPVRSINRPPADSGPSSHVLSGIVQDESGQPLPGAVIEVVSGDPLFRGKATRSDQDGVFRLVGVWGEVRIRVDKAGYHIDVQTVVVNADVGISVRLLRARLADAIPSDTIQVGGTIRAVTNQPPCDAVMWDALAPCRRFDFVSTVPGRLEITVTYLESEMDATFVLPFSNTYLETSEEIGSREFFLTASIAAFERYQLRVNSYYQQLEFNLHAEFFPLAR